MSELKWTRYPLDILPHGITGNFGDWYGNRYHKGTDIGVVIGTPVYAPADGVSVTFTNDGSFGHAVCLLHERTGWYSLYAHLSRVSVVPGMNVQAGQQIGLSGNSGTLTTGPHLHWQVCSRPTFPTDISFSRDPMKVPFEDDEEEDEMTPEQLARLERLERIVAANGIDTDGDMVADRFGVEALETADAGGWSAFLTAQNSNQRIAEHEADHPGGGSTIGAHTHAPGEVMIEL